MFNLTVDRAFFPHLIMTPLIGERRPTSLGYVSKHRMSNFNLSYK